MRIDGKRTHLQAPLTCKTGSPRSDASETRHHDNYEFCTSQPEAADELAPAHRPVQPVLVFLSSPPKTYFTKVADESASNIQVMVMIDLTLRIESDMY